MVVVDASAFGAIIFSEPEGALVLERLGAETHLAAPSILPFELADTALAKIKKRPADETALRQNLVDGLDRRVQFRSVDFVAVVDLALDTGLSAYDASYLWLARNLGVPLVTLDKKLAAAAEKF